MPRKRKLYDDKVSLKRQSAHKKAKRSKSTTERAHRETIPSGKFKGASLAQENIMQLQRTFGNQAVSRMLMGKGRPGSLISPLPESETDQKVQRETQKTSPFGKMRTAEDVWEDVVTNLEKKDLDWVKQKKDPKNAAKINTLKNTIDHTATIIDKSIDLYTNISALESAEAIQALDLAKAEGQELGVLKGHNMAMTLGHTKNVLAGLKTIFDMTDAEERQKWFDKHKKLWQAGAVDKAVSISSLVKMGLEVTGSAVSACALVGYGAALLTKNPNIILEARKFLANSAKGFETFGKVVAMVTVAHSLLTLFSSSATDEEKLDAGVSGISGGLGLLGGTAAFAGGAALQITYQEMKWLGKHVYGATVINTSRADLSMKYEKMRADGNRLIEPLEKVRMVHMLALGNGDPAVQQALKEGVEWLYRVIYEILHNYQFDVLYKRYDQDRTIKGNLGFIASLVEPYGGRLENVPPGGFEHEMLGQYVIEIGDKVLEIMTNLYATFDNVLQEQMKINLKKYRERAIF